MKFSLTTAQYYSSIDLKSSPIDELVGKIGRQLGEVETYEVWDKKYDGIVVAKVISCAKHPNADKLNVCRIDDGGVVQHVQRGDDGFVQVVCGAPNVAAGQLVAWLPPGSTVPSSLPKDPFVLEARELRGEVSNGMLASPQELGLSNNHGGILVINPQDVGEDLAKPGTPFSKLYGLDDVVIEIENKMFTHRPDCFGFLGVAREIAGIQGLAFHSPDWYLRQQELPVADRLPLRVQVEATDLVPRFMAVVLDNVKVAPSPTWLRAALARLGTSSINNVVDLTNYYMLVTGQPLHAYDYAKVKGFSSDNATLVVRMGNEDELALLNGKTLKFDSDAVMIATDQQSVAVGGVMGGSGTEVDDSTTTIVLECANFDMYNIRRTSMKYGLFTDAVTRFTKGQSSQQTDRVLAKVVSELSVLTGAQVASKVWDVHDELPQASVISVDVAFINKRLGSELIAEEMANLLRNVEIDVSVIGDTLKVTSPFWRTDLEISEDIVEEVGRLHGYDNLPQVLPLRPMKPAPTDELINFKDVMRQHLAAAGASELLTYSFVHEKLLKSANQDPELAYQLNNAISPELQYYRLTLTPSLLDKVYSNIRSGHDEFAIFEINKTHSKRLPEEKFEKGVPTEANMLALVYAASDKKAKTKTGAAFYQAKYQLQLLADELGVNVRYKPFGETRITSALSPFEASRSALVVAGSKDTPIGVVGEYAATVRRALKVPAYSAGFELDVDALKLATPQLRSYQVLSKFPSSKQDISLKVASDVSYVDIQTLINKALTGAAKNRGYQTSLQTVDIYQSEDEQSKHFTFRITITHPERTLTTDEVNTVIDDVAQIAKDTLTAERL